MQRFIREHPGTSFGLLASIGSVFALRPLPSSVPLVALLVQTRLATQYIIPRPHRWLRIGLLWLAITAGCTISFASAGSTAINSFGASIAYSAVFSALGLIPFIICSLLRIRGLAFPAVWSTWWWFITSESPIGRLGAWSPLYGYETYAWTRPVFGELAIDWIVGAWCEVLAGFVASQMMGHRDQNEEMPAEEDTPLLLPVDSPTPNTTPSKRVIKSSNQISIMTIILVVATIPSTFINPLPPRLHPLPGENRRDIGVACVLPELDNVHPPFDLFLKETRAIAGRAHIVLWPEGAVSFDSEADRNNKLEIVQNTTAINGIWVGVAFADPVPGHGEDAKGKRRNGIAIVSSDGVVLEYYKRNLVPCKHIFYAVSPHAKTAPVVESFPQVKGTLPPSIIDIKLGSKSKPSAQWNITLSASICLDFAHPSHDLASKPSLILGPARTWHTNVGRVMMEMAKQRAEELGTRVLWCDGGEGGLSGIVGMGESGVQVGHGTWVRRLSFELPVDEKKTAFGRAGALWGLWLVWAIALGSIPARYTSKRPSVTPDDVWRRLRALFQRSRGTSQPAPNLLED